IPSPAVAGEGGRRPEGGAFGIAARMRLEHGVCPLHPFGELPPLAGEAKQKRPLSRCAPAPPPLRGGSETNPFPRRRGKVAGGREGALFAGRVVVRGVPSSAES